MNVEQLEDREWTKEMEVLGEYPPPNATFSTTNPT
jgi:hypothetical protein